LDVAARGTSKAKEDSVACQTLRKAFETNENRKSF